MTTQNEFLQGYIFHYNPYTQMWAGIKREDNNDYFNGTLSSEHIILHENINDIIEYLKTLYTTGELH